MLEGVYASNRVWDVPDDGYPPKSTIQTWIKGEGAMSVRTYIGAVCSPKCLSLFNDQMIRVTGG